MSKAKRAAKKVGPHSLLIGSVFSCCEESLGLCLGIRIGLGVIMISSDLESRDSVLYRVFQRLHTFWRL
jgi:hypothetical protein